MSTQTREHPSNVLDRGQARDFLHATTLAMAAAQAERQVARDLDRKFGALPAEDRIDAALDQYEADAVAARAIYHAGLEYARIQIIADLRDAGLDDWADAYATNDYSRLAI